MDTITFECEEYTIQLVCDRVLIWKGLPDHEADIEMDSLDLRNILSTAHMLIKD